MIDEVSKQVKRCFTCKHLTNLYQIEDRFYGQCWVDLPDEIRKGLPSCFYRNATIMVGLEDGYEKIWNNNGHDCPYWVDKSEEKAT